MPDFLVHRPPRTPGRKPRIVKIRKPAPVAEYVMPVVVAMTLVAGILAGVLALEASSANPTRSDPIVFGEAAQPGFRYQKVDLGSGRPVRYNPCEPIHYVVDPRQAPPGAVDDVHQAVRTIAAAMGTTFIYDGTTDESDVEREPIQPARYGARWAPVLIGWHHLGQNLVSATPLGEGGSVIRQNAQGESVYVTGSISLNADFPGVVPGFGRGRTWGKILLHEIGHVVGLGHVSDQHQLMYPTTTDGPSELGTGDRIGLINLGVSSGCLATPVPAT